MSESPVITLPDDHPRKQQLWGKLGEYQGRLILTKDPESQMDAICKIAVLGTLLRDGKVATWDICQELSQKHGENFDVSIFNIACAVIIDYCNTGGQNVYGGTGL